MSRFTEQQARSIPNDGPRIMDLVIIDIEDYAAYGIRKYGVALQPNNGRDPLIDVYQESLSITHYLRQLLYEKYGE